MMYNTDGSEVRKNSLRGGKASCGRYPFLFYNGFFKIFAHARSLQPPVKTGSAPGGLIPGTFLFWG